MRYSLVSIILFFAFGTVQGHGGIFNYTIGGVDYAGHYPFLLEDQQPESIQRRWWADPIQDVNHPWLACNRGNPLATRISSLHAPIAAGENITVRYPPPELPPNYNRPTEVSTPWTNEPSPPMSPFGPSYPWVHSLGPLFVYLAPCNGPCEAFEPTGEDRVWFKIYESGFLGGYGWDGLPYNIGRGPAWDQSRLPNAGWSVQIPTDLRPGNYLIRHEIIMIELMPPQHYPNCAHLTVTGEGDKLPGEDYLVSFPGAYSLDEPGLAVAGDLYSPRARETFNYTIPGPKVWRGD
ncbi:hypothetical protein S40285_05472 [Stachybotrys chlorohalonatus IBT 40285]|uniref:lytic cellulose monooxygenase (C4-dehydrogenating) n=1 Tax=Stachybotrys chlorohalonatus (strain IBT 40285) TaxID=1283841 RepID=A0A084QYK7_STAC4|nr:hypothetical protein S40285_05472 [Stachybotrys chlorohalonata IBT 40285]